MGSFIGPSLYELREALALEKLILANLADTIGWEHPAQQSSRARIAALESLLDKRETRLADDISKREAIRGESSRHY